VSDIFQEVEEDVRKERLEKWWKKYGDFVIAGVSVIVIAVAGWKLWQHYQEQQRLKASSEYMSALQISAAGQNDLAAQAYAQIAKKAPSGYATVAELAQADELLASGKVNEAVALYMKLAGKDNSGLGSVARIRAAWAQADTISTAELRTLLAPVNDSKSSWRFMAQEILAYRDYRDGKSQQAMKEFQTLASATDAPSSIRARSNAMATLIRTSGGKNFGSVPMPAQPAPGAAQGTP
jgi:hypothetical protein